MLLTVERKAPNMTLNYNKILTTSCQTAAHKGLYATSFSNMGRQAEQMLSGNLSDLNNA